MHHQSYGDGMKVIDELEALPDKVAEILKQSDKIKLVAQKYAEAEGMLFLGRQHNYPTAMEGALKMKEISYIYASGHPSGELKHGIIALVKADMPCVFIAPDDTVFDKNVSNIEEVKARKGPVIAVTTEGKTELEHVADDVVYIPDCADYLTPDSDLGPAAAVRLPPGGRPRLRRRQAAQSGEERDRRVAGAGMAAGARMPAVAGNFWSISVPLSESRCAAATAGLPISLFIESICR